MTWRLCIFLLLTLPLWGEAESIPDRYEVRFANGDVVLDKEIRDWEQDKKPPRIGNRPLFDANNPAVLVRDLTLSARLHAPFVALANGDVLPGRLIGANAADANGHLPAHFLVVPRPPLDVHSDEQILRVHQDRVARIVFREFSDRLLSPGDVRFTDGRVVRVESVRWRESGLRALTADGLVTATWAELAEIRLPEPDIHAALIDDLQPPENPGNHPRIVRIETLGGATLTGWQDRHVRGKNKRHQHSHSLQPSWALNAIRVPLDRIVLRSYRPANAIPLSSLPAEALEQRSLTGYLWPWQRNRNLRGGMLASGAEIADFGIGTHAYSEIAFDLPPIATRLRGRVGLDRVVGSGGCCELRIFRDRIGGKALWQSGIRTGSQAPVAFDLNLAGAKRVILQTDAAEDNHPKGADPLDIRDEASWLQPVVLANSAKLQMPHDLPRLFPLLEKWTMSPASVKTRNTFSGKTGAWLPIMLPADGNNTTDAVLRFERELRVSLRNAHLSIGIARDDPTINGHSVAVLVNGEALSSSANGNPNSNRAQWHVDTRTWSLAPFIGQTVKLEAQVIPTKPGPTSGLFINHMALSPLILDLQRGKTIRPDLALSTLPAANTHGVTLKDKQYVKHNKDYELRFRNLPVAPGYGLQGGSRVSYALHPSWQRFVAVLGLVDGWADIALELRLDDAEEPFWRSPKIKRGEPAQQVEVAIPKGHRLTLSMAGHHDHFLGLMHPGFMTDGSPYVVPTIAENLARNATITASSSSESWEGEGKPARIIDDNPGTRWSSDYADNQQLILDFGEPKPFKTLTLLWEVAAAKHYTVSVSDDEKAWRRVSVQRDGIQGPRTDLITLEPVTARFIRIDLQERATEYGFSLYELKVE
jgi:hypothetical protein